VQLITVAFVATCAGVLCLFNARWLRSSQRRHEEDQHIGSAQLARGYARGARLIGWCAIVAAVILLLVAGVQALN